MKIISLIAVLLVVASPAPARATTDMTDASDLWSSATEQGWGVNLIHQDDTVFATLFVYTPGGQPIWYVGSGMVASATEFSFTGAWYRTNGPWFGGTFNPAAVGNQQVGTATFRYQSINVGTFSYTVDGVTVTKPVTRQTWKRNKLAGGYIGAVIGTYSGCVVSGYQEEPAVFAISHPGATISISAAFAAGGTCSYAGTYSQAGRMGDIVGTVSCSNGAGGTFRAYEVEANITGLTGRADANLGSGCTWSGRFGGLTRGAP